jgi:hypothetical protein
VHRKITLILANGHYSLASNPGRKQISSIDGKPKRPLAYQEYGVNNLVKVYDGQTTRSFIIPEFRKLKSKLYGKCCFIAVEKNRKTGIFESPEEAYARIHEERDVLLKESKKIGLTIDLFMYNSSYKQTALWLFEKLFQLIRKWILLRQNGSLKQ